MVNKELQETLTIRSLLHLCTACKNRPSAQMLAFAVQNSIPSLVGLPMDNQNPAFYINIAQRYFCPLNINVQMRTEIYSALNLMDLFSSTDLEKKVCDAWPTGWIYYTYAVINRTLQVTGTHTGRKFVKDLILEWKAFYQQTLPNDPRYSVFIDGIISILDHGFVLRRRCMLPGLIGQTIIREYDIDEHL